MITSLRTISDQHEDPSHYVKALIQQIYSSLKGRDTKYDLRMGLVGYGGDGAFADAHIYTTNGCVLLCSPFVVLPGFQLPHFFKVLIHYGVK